MVIVEELLLKEWDCLTEELGAGNIDKARLIAVKYKTRLEQFVNFKTVLVKLYEDKLESFKKYTWKNRSVMSRKIKSCMK